MSDTKHNEKLPKDAISKGDITPEYGFVHGHADACGGHYLEYRNPDDHKKTYSQRLSPSGHYETIQHDEDKKELRTHLAPGDVRNYTGGGKSTHVDGHEDMSCESTSRKTVTGDYGVSMKDYYHGSSKDLVGRKNGKVDITTGSSNSKDYAIKKGDLVSTFDGSEHKNREGDEISAVHGTKFTMIKEGDYGLHVQGGNYDARVDSGKLQIYSGDALTVNSAADVLIKSSTKITLQVGSSKIEITSSGITIDASTVTIKGTTTKIEPSGAVNIKPSGIVDIQGSSTKIQGGGMSAPPTTFG